MRRLPGYKNRNLAFFILRSFDFLYISFLKKLLIWACVQIFFSLLPEKFHLRIGLRMNLKRVQEQDILAIV